MPSVPHCVIFITWCPPSIVLVIERHSYLTCVIACTHRGCELCFCFFCRHGTFYASFLLIALFKYADCLWVQSICLFCSFFCLLYMCTVQGHMGLSIIKINVTLKYALSLVLHTQTFCYKGLTESSISAVCITALHNTINCIPPAYVFNGNLFNNLMVRRVILVIGYS